MCVLLPIVSVVMAAQPATQARGIIGKPAPSWGVTEWINLPADRQALDVTDYRGRIVYLFGFQASNAASDDHGFPALKQVIDHYAGVSDVACVAVQIASGGSNGNSAADTRGVIERYALEIPVGNAAPLTERYHTGGMPWTIIIDREGVVRFNDSRITSAQAIDLIDRLVAEAGPVPTLPESRMGRALLGRPLDLSQLTWITPAAPPALQGKVTLVRWFTDSCPFCATSLPAIMALRRELQHPDLQTVAVYHAKPPGNVPRAAIAAHARRLGYDGPLAADCQWIELRRQYLDDHPRAVTSVTFVLDRTGRIRYIHPGPVFGPSETDAPLNKEYLEVHQAVRALLESP